MHSKNYWEKLHCWRDRNRVRGYKAAFRSFLRHINEDDYFWQKWQLNESHLAMNKGYNYINFSLFHRVPGQSDSLIMVLQDSENCKCETFFSVVFTQVLYITHMPQLSEGIFSQMISVGLTHSVWLSAHLVIIFYKAWQNYATTHAICQNRNGIPSPRIIFLFANETFHQTVRVHLITKTLQPHNWNLELSSLHWLKDKTELKTSFHFKHLPFFGGDMAWQIFKKSRYLMCSCVWCGYRRGLRLWGARVWFSVC